MFLNKILVRQVLVLQTQNVLLKDMTLFVVAYLDTLEIRNPVVAQNVLLIQTALLIKLV